MSDLYGNKILMGLQFGCIGRSNYIGRGNYTVGRGNYTVGRGNYTVGRGNYTVGRGNHAPTRDALNIGLQPPNLQAVHY